MFIEPQIAGDKRGWIEVISGAMFSGKTEELMRRVRRAFIANQRVELFKPKIDTRYDAAKIVSHDEHALTSTPVDDAAAIPALAQGADVVGIDEAQFFDDQLPAVCERLALSGIRVIVAGLDMDYLGRPFGPIPHLLASAEYITKLHAICMRCGNIANFSYRKTESDEKVLLGEHDRYEPRCRVCYHLKDG